MASIYIEALNDEAQKIESMLAYMCAALVAESESLRDFWSEVRRRLIEIEKSKYSPSQERKMKTKTYSQLNFAARAGGGGMELYWYTANSDRHGKKHFNPIPMGSTCRKTRTYYQPYLREAAKKWEWKLVKETELQAKNIRKAKSEIVTIRRHMKKLIKFFDEIDIESVKRIDFNENHTSDVAIKNNEARDDECINSRIAPDPRR